MSTMQSVINRAAKDSAKYKKSDAINAIRLISETVNPEDDQAVYNLAVLYRLLVSQTVPASKKQLTDFRWCALACADKKDIRYYLRYVYVTECYITGCNGHVLHRVKNTSCMVPGYYLPNGDKIDLDATYPDVDRVIPKDSELSDFDISKPEYSKISKTILRATFGNYGVNKKYLDNALRCPGALQASKRDTAIEGPLRLDFDGNRLAVIMPLRF